ncbi:endonuclease [Campylobacter lari]|nr:endonuclease [Campylobacter lari]EAI4303607.1 endonuclease [Campylobacter lari]EAJ0334473.1 endonuclease [Campylobacter lari]EAJ1119968.1 endonuclease [Campylobacter lari]EAJ6178315.1 endonuclease [Campylobacter lari]
MNIKNSIYKKGNNFKECYKVPNYEVDNLSIKRYKFNCDVLTSNNHQS